MTPHRQSLQLLYDQSVLVDSLSGRFFYDSKVSETTSLEWRMEAVLTAVCNHGSKIVCLQTMDPNKIYHNSSELWKDVCTFLGTEPAKFPKYPKDLISYFHDSISEGPFLQSGFAVKVDTESGTGYQITKTGILIRPIVNMLASSLKNMGISPKIFGGSTLGFHYKCKKAYGEFLTLAYLEENKHIITSRQQIAEKTEIKKTTLYEIIMQLLKYNLINELPKTKKLEHGYIGYKITELGTQFLQALKVVESFCKDPTTFVKENSTYTKFSRPDSSVYKSLMEACQARRKSEATEKEMKILNIVRENSGIQITAISKMIGIGTEATRMRLRSLERMGKVYYKIEHLPGSLIKKLFYAPQDKNFALPCLEEKIVDNLVRSRTALSIEDIKRMYQNFNHDEIVSIIDSLLLKNLQSKRIGNETFYYLRRSQYLGLKRRFNMIHRKARKRSYVKKDKTQVVKPRNIKLKVKTHLEEIEENLSEVWSTSEIKKFFGIVSKYNPGWDPSKIKDFTDKLFGAITVEVGSNPLSLILSELEKERLVASHPQFDKEWKNVVSKKYFLQ